MAQSQWIFIYRSCSSYPARIELISGSRVRRKISCSCKSISIFVVIGNIQHTRRLVVIRSPEIAAPSVVYGPVPSQRRCRPTANLLQTRDVSLPAAPRRTALPAAHRCDTNVRQSRFASCSSRIRTKFSGVGSCAICVATCHAAKHGHRDDFNEARTLAGFCRQSSTRCPAQLCLGVFPIQYGLLTACASFRSFAQGISMPVWGFKFRLVPAQIGP